MRNKNQSVSDQSELTKEKYIPVEMSFTSLATECTFLSSSHIFLIEGQETGVVYEMGVEDSSGFIFNPDWDFGE